MKNQDLKDALIIGGLCLSISAFFSFILCISLIQLFTFFKSIDLSFLTDDDWTGYEDMRITITIVPDEPEIPLVENSNPVPQYNPIRGTSLPRHYHDYDEWLPGNDFSCSPLQHSVLIPMVGWHCDEY